MKRKFLIIPFICILLGGCFVSENPLLTGANADWPYGSGTRFSAGGTAGYVLTVDNGSYSEHQPSGDVLNRILLKSIGGGLYIIQEQTSGQDGENYDYGLLAVNGSTASRYMFDSACNANAAFYIQAGSVSRVSSQDKSKCFVDSLDGLASIFRSLYASRANSEKPEVLTLISPAPIGPVANAAMAGSQLPNNAQRASATASSDGMTTQQVLDLCDSDSQSDQDKCSNDVLGTVRSLLQSQTYLSRVYCPPTDNPLAEVTGLTDKLTDATAPDHALRDQPLRQTLPAAMQKAFPCSSESQSAQTASSAATASAQVQSAMGVLAGAAANAEQLSMTCLLNSGPRAGQYQVFGSGARPVTVGKPCNDGRGSQGIGVADGNQASVQSAALASSNSQQGGPSAPDNFCDFVQKLVQSRANDFLDWKGAEDNSIAKDHTAFKGTLTMNGINGCTLDLESEGNKYSCSLSGGASASQAASLYDQTAGQLRACRPGWTFKETTETDPGIKGETLEADDDGLHVRLDSSDGIWVAIQIMFPGGDPKYIVSLDFTNTRPPAAKFATPTSGATDDVGKVAQSVARDFADYKGADLPILDVVDHTSFHGTFLPYGAKACNLYVRRLLSDGKVAMPSYNCRFLDDADSDKATAMAAYDRIAAQLRADRPVWLFKEEYFGQNNADSYNRSMSTALSTVTITLSADSGSGLTLNFESTLKDAPSPGPLPVVKN